MIALAPSARDRFLVGLLACTGLRIGEALGLHHGDMHLLASSRAVGCGVEDPHVHVRRRTDNPNQALAKSRHHRLVPVTADVVAHYTDYQYGRDQVAEAAESETVFVNLLRPPPGRAVSYPNPKEMFDRLARGVGHACRPHMPRHSAATRWLRGVDRDVWCSGFWATSPRCQWSAADMSTMPRHGRRSSAGHRADRRAAPG
ncbi:tyrosine-type recombinase/integrase [Streptomyces hygroscopicus]|uniref:tyrosine-type recombinase/integrase n=1 Tax=Streptomyces hygroscopicus TaxID=1912 RepID=UPI00369ACA1D